MIEVQARTEAKRVVPDAKARSCEELYHKLDTKEEEKDIYRIARVREKKIREFNHVKCIKGKDDQVLISDDQIKERWRSHFSKLRSETRRYT